MRKLFDSLVCIAAAACMMAFPVMLLGLTPWFGDWVLHTSHASAGRGLLSQLLAVLTMLGSSAGVLMLGVPLFGLVVWGLMRAGGVRRDRPMVRRLPRAATVDPDEAPRELRTHAPSRRSAPEEDYVPIEVMKELARRARAARRAETESAGEEKAPRRSAAERLGVPPS